MKAFSSYDNYFLRADGFYTGFGYREIHWMWYLDVAFTALVLLLMSLVRKRTIAMLILAVISSMAIGLCAGVALYKRSRTKFEKIPQLWNNRGRSDILQVYTSEKLLKQITAKGG